MAIISGEQYCQSVPDNTNKMSNHLWFYCQCKCVQFTDAITWNQLPDLSIQTGQPPAHTVDKLGGLLPIRCQTVTLYDSIPNWESRSSIGLYLDPTCSGFSQSALAPFFFFFLVNISTSHRGISWCSESFFSKPHSPLCCKHLYKGQVQRLRGVMLVSSPVRRSRRRSNEPSNQCYLYTAQWHTADVVARGVTQSSWSNICF